MIIMWLRVNKTQQLDIQHCYLATDDHNKQLL